MAIGLRRRSFTARAWLLALFVAFAFVLGGGGSPNPTTELLLQILFVVIAIAWLWLPAGKIERTPIDRWAIVLLLIPLVIPIVQLMPLPPSIWTGLPGRDDAVAALSLVGREHSWRPLSLSPSRTLASLLAIVPAVFCLYAVASLDSRDRRLVLGVTATMAVVSALIGAIQLVAGQRGFNLYSQFHVGWVTGFQANRNAEADVLLIGFLALVTLAAPYLAGNAGPLNTTLDRRARIGLVSGAALFLLAATAMTGSRAGISLIVVGLAAALLIFSTAGRTDNSLHIRPIAWVALLVAVAGFAIFLFAYSEYTALGRVAERFVDAGDDRGHVWQDAWFALKRYWPLGFGLGGFEPAMFPAERLEYLDPLIPNRAHNEFIEIGLEAGILGYVVLAAAATVCVAMTSRAWRKVPAARAETLFGVSVLIMIALHSVVDYPLRSMAVACLAGVAGGILAGAKASAA